MKIFVPRYRHDMPSSNNDVLNSMFIEVNESDLPRVILLWEELDKVGPEMADQFFTQKSRDACENPVQDKTLEPFLRRPHVTVHCGAKGGSPEFKQIADDAMVETGRLVARHGFNLLYGGGNQGLMGAAIKGFREEINRKRYPDQYSLQVIPAMFVKGVSSVNGLRPANEGLCHDTDAAIIMPDFVTRRELLDGRCAASVTGPGGIGSLDELTDILVHIKTGLRGTLSYVLNTHVPALNQGYYDTIRQFVLNAATCGMENATTLDHVRLLETPALVFTDLMQRLDQENRDPHMLYKAYCLARGISTIAKPQAARPDPQ